MNKHIKRVRKYEELVKAIFDRISEEYERYYWHMYHKDVYSPFNSSDMYMNDVFEVRGYNKDANDINFNYKDGQFCATWYKNCHKGLYFWSNRGKRINAEFLNKMLVDCLGSMKWDLEDKKNQNM